MKKLFLGIDTSNYTTSACLISSEDFVFLKTPLSVKYGEKGVRQSEAVFQHTKNLPTLMGDLFEKARGKFNDFELAAVGVSSTPRRQEGSYMPCFLSGVASAYTAGATAKCPVYEFSHQEGHIRSAILGSGVCSSLSHFYSFHLSGGTCELLEVFCDNGRYQVNIIADSADITLGQLIDRTGVMLGLQFPCGLALETLAFKCSTLPTVTVNGSAHINLSGFENKTLDMYKNGCTTEEIAGYVFGVCISAIKKLLKIRTDNNLPVVFSGGVCSSSIIRDEISKHCNAYFAPAIYSADNAIGIAALTQDVFSQGE